MNIGDIKQLIRQRCRLDPRLTDPYMLSYARECVMNISNSARTFKRTYDITPTTDVMTYNMPTGFLSIDFIEYGSTEDYTDNCAARLVSASDYTITKDSADPVTLVVNVPKLNLTFKPDPTKTIRVHYSALIEDILAADWATDVANLDTYMQREASLCLIIYVAYQHKRNYQRDMLSKVDGDEFENAKLDLERLYNERVENP